MIFSLAMIKRGVRNVENTNSKIGVLKVANVLFSSMQIISNLVYRFYSHNLLTILVKSAIIYEKGVRYERIRL